jgi:DNA adenine methylase Dam
MKSLKTPLRYPGGKSRAVKYLIPKMPKDITEYREPFLGGGSVAIAFTKEYPDIPVWVNDLYEPLVNFWQMLQKSPDGLFCLLEAYKNTYDTPGKARALFDEMKIQLNSADTPNLQKAAAFYVVNKCSFSGLTESSSFSPQASDHNFTMRGITNLSKYSELIENWKITCGSYWDMMMTSAPVGTFWFFDPPYDIKDNLYGKKGELHKGFNHEEFHAWITQGNVKDRWMITYNTNPTLMEWYDGYYQTKWDLTYTMRSVGDYMNEQKDRAELLITNYDETISNGIFELNKSNQEVGSY